MKQFLVLGSLCGMLAAFSACGGNGSPEATTGGSGVSDMTTLQVTDVKVGTGTEATNGKVVTKKASAAAPAKVAWASVRPWMPASRSIPVRAPNRRAA